MPDLQQGFEQQDLAGNTIQVSGNVPTVSTPFPLTPDKVISEFFIKVPTFQGQPLLRFMEFSIDNVFFMKVTQGEAVSWLLKGDKKQIWFKAPVVGVRADVFINFEDF